MIQMFEKVAVSDVFALKLMSSHEDQPSRGSVLEDEEARW